MPSFSFSAFVSAALSYLGAPPLAFVVVGLAALLIYIGVYPQPFLDTSAATMHGVQQWLGTAFTQLASAR